MNFDRFSMRVWWIKIDVWLSLKFRVWIDKQVYLIVFVILINPNLPTRQYPGAWSTCAFSGVMDNEETRYDDEDDDGDGDRWALSSDAEFRQNTANDNTTPPSPWNHSQHSLHSIPSTSPSLSLYILILVSRRRDSRCRKRSCSTLRPPRTWWTNSELFLTPATLGAMSGEYHSLRASWSSALTMRKIFAMPFALTSPSLPWNPLFMRSFFLHSTPSLFFQSLFCV